MALGRSASVRGCELKDSADRIDQIIPLSASVRGCELKDPAVFHKAEEGGVSLRERL